MPATKVEDPRVLLRAHMARRGQRPSRQRDLIVEAFLRTEGHVSVDELWQRARVEDWRVAQATVYRTMRLLVDAGLAIARQFGDGQARYEVIDLRRSHHDHLICTQCGAIVEFVDERIENLQEEVAKRHQFHVARHRLELYGQCRRCYRRDREHR